MEKPRITRKFSFQEKTSGTSKHESNKNATTSKDNKKVDSENKSSLLSCYSCLIMDQCRALQSMLLDVRLNNDKNTKGNKEKKTNNATSNNNKLAQNIKVLKIHNELNSKFFDMFKENLTKLKNEEIPAADKYVNYKETRDQLKEMCLNSKEMSHDIITLSQEIVKSLKTFCDKLTEVNNERHDFMDEKPKTKGTFLSRAKELAKAVRRRSTSRHERYSFENVEKKLTFRSPSKESQVILTNLSDKESTERTLIESSKIVSMAPKTSRPSPSKRTCTLKSIQLHATEIEEASISFPTADAIVQSSTKEELNCCENTNKIKNSQPRHTIIRSKIPHLCISKVVGNAKFEDKRNGSLNKLNKTMSTMHKRFSSEPDLSNKIDIWQNNRIEFDSTTQLDASDLVTELGDQSITQISEIAADKPKLEDDTMFLGLSTASEIGNSVFAYTDSYIPQKIHNNLQQFLHNSDSNRCIKEMTSKYHRNGDKKFGNDDGNFATSSTKQNNNAISHYRVARNGVRILETEI